MISKANKKEMKECFTCLICNNLYVHPTTISECLHTFCRKCIEDKIIEEKLKVCPVCNVDLGVAPLDKLRRDSTWEDLSLKVFKTKPESVKPKPKQEIVKPKPNQESVKPKPNQESVKPKPKQESVRPKPKQYFRKKKKAQASLVATSSRVSLTSPDPNHDAPLEKLDEKVEAVPLIQSSSKPNSSFRTRQRKNPKPIRNETLLEPEQTHKGGANGLAEAGTSKGCLQKENNSKKDKEEISISSHLSKSLQIVEPAITPSVKKNQDFVSSSDADVTEKVSGEKSEENQNSVFNHSEEDTEEVHVEVNQNTALITSDGDTEEVSCEKPKNNNENVSTPKKISGAKGKEKSYSPPVLRPRRQRNMNSSSAGTSHDANPKAEASNKPVWFSLVAVANQNTDRPLAQIPTRYLRVTNGNLPVSYVKKYIVQKLSLESEEEVEIWLRQEPVCSTQRLHDLVDWWVQTTPIAERRSARVGESGAEFVMVLYYSRSHLFC